MGSDERCRFYINGFCYEKVTHGFSEKQLREGGEMKPCDMGTFNGQEIRDFPYCWTHRMHFDSAVFTPGIIASGCVKAVQDAKNGGEVDGEIVDLQT